MPPMERNHSASRYKFCEPCSLLKDKVRFDARPSKKPSGKVKWDAATVYLCRNSDRNGNGNGNRHNGDFNGNEVFMSDDEFDLQDLLRGKFKKYQSREAGLSLLQATPTWVQLARGALLQLFA
ncbi:hypothetical protein HPB48_006235 [Haemaphysalis longicornis]|uniref:Uncharacterized protein n=1 Tax=Haemaphysalis longicornis TaxID=44386 RepID=A0A9J6GRZ9_HAELO|nr:hypothetical protein HPB48_006235 [Haemaphysalis longicornis]